MTLWDLGDVFNILAVFAVAYIFLIIIGLICFIFPQKCNKCGKHAAFDSVASDTVKYYESGWWKITNRSFSHKKCLSCGHEGGMTLLYESERLEKG